MPLGLTAQALSSKGFTLVFDKLTDLIVTAIKEFPKEAALLSGVALAPAALPMPWRCFAAAGLFKGSGAAAAWNEGFWCRTAEVSKDGSNPCKPCKCLATLLLLGGGLEGTMRQLTNFFSERCGSFASLRLNSFLAELV